MAFRLSQRYSALYHFTLISLFVMILLVPIVGFLFNDPEETSLAEKRRLTKLPSITFARESIKAFPRKFEEFVGDHFGFRDKFIYVHNLIKFRLFNKSTVSSVAIGEDGWLFWAKARILEDYRGKIPFTESELSAWKNVLENRQKWLLEKGAQYLYVIPPNKHTIYSEYLPGYARRQKGEMRLDQFVSYFANNSTVPVVDLREPLFEAKKARQVYYKTDMHWNFKGGYAGYKSIIAHLQKYRLNLPLVAQEDVTELESEKIGDLAQLMGLDQYLTENISVIYLKHTCAQEIPFHISNLNAARYFSSGCKQRDRVAVVFRDSYSNYLVPFLSESFKQVVYIWHPYDHTTMKMILRTVKPDVVIDEVLQRYLALPPPIENGEMNDEVNLSRITRRQNLFDLNESDNINKISTNKKTEISISSGGLRILATDEDPALYLPKFDPATKQKNILIRIAIDSPGDTVVQLFYKTPKKPYYSEANSISRPIIKGYNDIYIQASKENMTGEIRLDPGALSGQYSLHQFQVDTIEWL